MWFFFFFKYSTVENSQKFLCICHKDNKDVNIVKATEYSIVAVKITLKQVIKRQKMSTAENIILYGNAEINRTDCHV